MGFFLDKIMYNCSKCRKNFNETPAFKNNAGSFCITCKNKIHEKAKLAMKLKREQSDKLCLWCKKVELTDGNKVCNPCQKNRDWLLSCIRESDRPFKYVSRIEERELPIRIEKEEKRKEQLEFEQQPKQLEIEEDKPIIDIPVDRLERLEMLMLKLVENLGGI